MKIEKIKGKFFQKSIVSVDQFEKRDIEILFKIANQMKISLRKREKRNDLSNYLIAELFYQPSTRTFSSFLASALKLGADVLPIHGMQTYSSVVKGESLEDTIRTIEAVGADIIVLRHPEDDSAEVAAKVSRVPIINAGAGVREHPTQALLDLYTIWQEKGRLENLHVGIVGDLKYGRTTHSLVKLLTKMDKISLTFVSPPNLEMPMEIKEKLKSKKVRFQEMNDIEKVINQVDVLYWTRIQKEWFEKEGKLAFYEKIKSKFILTPVLMKKAKKDLVVMHPLPRVNEIDPLVDKDKRAIYFKQVGYGVPVRMALLTAVLRK
jgi:aspartate carbamoyltransferase catalytic subunit